MTSFVCGAKNQDLYRAELRKSDTVISCIGGFGRTDAYMELVNGEANIKLAEVIASRILAPDTVFFVGFVHDPLFETFNVCAAFSLALLVYTPLSGFSRQPSLKAWPTLGTDVMPKPRVSGLSDRRLRQTRGSSNLFSFPCTTTRRRLSSSASGTSKGSGGRKRLSGSSLGRRRVPAILPNQSSE